MLEIFECTPNLNSNVNITTIYNFLLNHKDEVPIKLQNEFVIITTYLKTKFYLRVGHNNNSIFLYLDLDSHPAFNTYLSKIVIVITSELEASIGVVWLSENNRPFDEHVLLLSSNILCNLGVKSSLITDDFTILTKDKKYHVSQNINSVLIEGANFLEKYGYIQYNQDDTMGQYASDDEVVRLYKFIDIYNFVKLQYKIGVETNNLDDITAKTWMTLLEPTQYLTMTFSEYMKKMWKESPIFYFQLEKFLDKFSSPDIFPEYYRLKSNTVFHNKTICNECIRNKLYIYQKQCKTLKQIMTHAPILNQLMNFIDEENPRGIIEFAYLNEDFRTRCIQTARMLFFILTGKQLVNSVTVSIKNFEIMMEKIDKHKIVTISAQSVPDGYLGHIFTVLKLEEDLFIISQSEVFSNTNRVYIGDRISTSNYLKLWYNFVYFEKSEMTAERIKLFEYISGKKVVESVENLNINFIKNGIFEIRYDSQSRDYLFDMNTCTNNIEQFIKLVKENISTKIHQDFYPILLEYIKKITVKEKSFHFELVNRDGSLNIR